LQHCDSEGRAAQKPQMETRWGTKANNERKWEYEHILHARRTGVIRKPDGRLPPHKEGWEYLVEWKSTQTRTWETHATMVGQNSTAVLRTELADAILKKGCHSASTRAYTTQPQKEQ